MNTSIVWYASRNDKKVSTLLTCLVSSGFELQKLERSAIPPDVTVLIFWTRNDLIDSHGLREELNDIASKSRLVSVLIDKLTVPGDIFPHQVIDLVNWRGSPKNAFYRDLVDLLIATPNRRPTPEPKGPKLSFWRRRAAGRKLFYVASFVGVLLVISEKSFVFYEKLL